MALTAAQKKAQKAEEAATKSAYEAAKAAMLNNLNTGLSDMKENVANDALTRGLARSSVPITVGADNETTMRTAYNTDLAGLTANRDSTLAQILARYASMGAAGRATNRAPTPIPDPSNRPTNGYNNPGSQNDNSNLGGAQQLNKMVNQGNVPREAAARYTGAPTPGVNMTPTSAEVARGYMIRNGRKYVL